MEKITSRRNPVLVHVKKLSSNRSYRLSHNEFVCDGAKILSEALSSGVEVKYVLAEHPYVHEIPDTVKVLLLGNGMLSSISALKNPHDLLFVCEIPDASPGDLSAGTYILLDNVQDPGNLGTIIRTADALSIDGVLLYGDCADVYNPKTIRASMGAVFRQRVFSVDVNVLRKLHKLRIVGTSADNTAKCISNLDLRDSLIILGNEGQGISKGLLNLCEDMATIPISQKSESLNVATAASIIMWEAKGKNKTSTGKHRVSR